MRSTLSTNFEEANLCQCCLTSDICIQLTNGDKGMKYILAWVVGVPGVVIVAWFVIAHVL
jgi:hypothetical protein